MIIKQEKLVGCSFHNIQHWPITKQMIFFLRNSEAFGKVIVLFVIMVYSSWMCNCLFGTMSQWCNFSCNISLRCRVGIFSHDVADEIISFSPWTCIWAPHNFKTAVSLDPDSTVDVLLNFCSSTLYKWRREVEVEATRTLALWAGGHSSGRGCNSLRGGTTLGGKLENSQAAHQGSSSSWPDTLTYEQQFFLLVFFIADDVFSFNSCWHG